MTSANATSISIGRDDGLSDAAVPSDASLESWIANALADFDVAGGVDVQIVSDEAMAQLNATFRGKDKSTNVLSFPAELDDSPIAHLGDIALCPAVIEREANEQGKPLEAHYAHMLTHGVLHLMGYDHIDDDSAEEMEQLERDILGRIGIADPYRI